MSLFDGIENAKIRQPRLYFRPGRYVARIDQMKTGATRKKINFFCVNMTVCVVLDVSAAVQNVQGPHRVGDKPSWMVLQSWDSFLSTVKGAICMCAGGSEADITNEVVQLAVGPGQPFAGEFMELDIRNQVNDKNQKTFTIINPVRMWSLEEVLSKLPSDTASSLGLVAA